MGIKNTAIESFNAQFGKTVASATVANGKAKLNGEQALAYSKLGDAETTALVKKLGKTIFQSGIGGMVDSLNIVTDNAKTSIVADDFTAVAKMAMLMLKKAESTVINVGTETYTVFWYANSSVYYCDMETERTTLVNALYGAPAAE